MTIEIGFELRNGRLDRGLSLAAVTSALGKSPSWGSRLERGLLDHVSILELSQYAAVVGLDLSTKTYPGGQPIRDAAQTALLARFRGQLHRSLTWRTEVPLPIPRDPRGWDGLIRGSDWSFGVEAESAPNDAQAVDRRIMLKIRDGGVDGAVLLLPSTRRTRTFLAAAQDVLRPNFPLDGPRTLELLRAGVRPTASSIVVL